jgi:hypothetical protein
MRDIKSKLRRCFERIHDDILEYDMRVKPIILDQWEYPHTHFSVTITDVESGEVLFDDIVDKHTFAREAMLFNLSYYSHNYINL